MSCAVFDPCLNPNTSPCADMNLAAQAVFTVNATGGGANRYRIRSGSGWRRQRQHCQFVWHRRNALWRRVDFCADPLVADFSISTRDSLTERISASDVLVKKI